MRSILRMGLSVVVATVLAASAAWAVDYGDIIELTARNVHERTLVQLIVDDGRAFELSAVEIVELRVAGVSERVIDAMIDPAAGEAWLAGDVYEREDGADGGETGNGDRSSLDQDYGQGEGGGDGSTPLVFSFGYYYGPLSRYYYDDPYYFPFWSAGHAYSYWPSYYAYGWRPAYDEYYEYPYNWYEYSSYYCHTYYDPAYWSEIGYTVQPGYGPTVWDHGPRFRGGGIVPPKGGRPDAVSGERLAVGSAGRVRNPAGPPAIHESENARTLADRAARSVPASREIRGTEAPASWPLVIPGATASVTRPGIAVRGGTKVSAAADRRVRAAAARELRAARERANAKNVADATRWARSFGEQHAASMVQENERWVQEWQRQVNETYSQPAEGPARSRDAAAAPPPPPAAPPARAEQPRTERAPAPDRGSAVGRPEAVDDAPATRSRGGR